MREKAGVKHGHESREWSHEDIGKESPHRTYHPLAGDPKIQQEPR